MTTNQISLINSISGSNAHRYLIKETFRIFKNKGYKVEIEKRIKNKRADLFLSKNKEEIIVECLLKPNYVQIKKKQENFKGHKILIVYPSSYEVNFPIEEYIDILRIELPNKIENNKITLTISEEVWEYLNADKSPGESFDEVLKRLLKIKEKKNGN
jgi:hypothetical protein